MAECCEINVVAQEEPPIAVTSEDQIITVTVQDTSSTVVLEVGTPGPAGANGADADADLALFYALAFGGGAL